jgi:hypothetical protein
MIIEGIDAMLELDHSPLGGSGAHRFMNCAGSFLLHKEQLESGEFENSESHYAKLGTAAHELCAVSLQTDTEPFEYLGKEFDGFTVGAEDGISLDAVQHYFNHCQDIRKAHDFKGWMLVEQTFKLPNLHPLLRGTVDFAFLAFDKIYLRDYKNGEGIGVSAKDNEQLLYYAFLLAVGDAQCCTMPNETIVSLGIVQPNFYGLFSEPEVWETTLGFVRSWGHDTLLPHMKMLMQPQDVAESDFVTGDHCQFCPVLLDCPKMQRAFKAYAAADEEFIAVLTNEELDQYYSQKEQARRFMTVLESTVHARLVGGSSIPSAKLVEKKTARIWRPEAITALKEAFGDQAFEAPKIKSPAAIEKLSSRGKAMSLEWGYKPESSGLAVAPVSDPKPEAKGGGNAKVFGNYTQDLSTMDF